MIDRYINVVRKSIENAELNISKISDEIINLPGMSGIKTRHFYNNLVNMINDARYLEIGTWKGSSVCSAMYKNKAKIVAIDNWCLFNGNLDKPDFLINWNKFKGENDATFIEQDCFTVDVSKLSKFNIYMYDGEHGEEDHYKALTHYIECLDNTFIFVVDDWNWNFVRNGTIRAIKDLNLKIEFEHEIFTPNNLTSDTWWNGIYIAVLSKKII